MGLFDLATPALFALSPEKAHQISIIGLKSGILPSANLPADSRLNVAIAGIDFPNPVGLAAGYDKNAEVPDAILRLGFGFAEVGTITPRRQSGNPTPRIFRLTNEKGIINRLGFNNEGHASALRRLEARKANGGILGVNIGANKDSKDFVADYEQGIETFYDLATYFTANISSPNTPGLRNLQAAEALETLLKRVFSKVREKEQETGKTVPVFLKIAPDLDVAELDEIADVVKASDLSALIVSNTTLDRDMLKYRTHRDEAGGLSGKPLFEKSTRILAEMRSRLKIKVPLIGVGGICNAEDAIAKIEAGASLVQLYTGMVYDGPCLPAKIVRGLSEHLDRKGSGSIGDLVGTRTGDWI
ncbi:MAG: quinone-dependent dihydroorotate dehydrogenase [Pseudomonadota bacterium]